jgi:uncharacterized protein YndB with AHSA1/START domain
MMMLMGGVEFELERVVHAPIEQVFARLTDIEGYNEWMPAKGSILKRTQLTSPGEPALGTTFLDETKYGPTPGEIVEFEPPHALVFHWWETNKRGRLTMEGWPGYELSAEGEDATLVRHHARLQTYGLWRASTPFLRRLAVRERTLTLEALQASFAG